MKPVVGLVPPDIRLILDRQQLSATSWLGDFNEDDIGKLAMAVRRMGQNASMEERLKFMGEYADHPDKFELTFIQSKCILKIAQAIRDRGIGHFIMIGRRRREIYRCGIIV